MLNLLGVKVSKGKSCIYPIEEVDDVGVAEVAAKYIAGRAVGELLFRALGFAVERLLSGKVKALLVLIFYFDEPVDWGGLASFLVKVLRKSGFDEEGEIKGEAKVGYSYYSLLDHVIDKISLGELEESELAEEDFHKIQELAVKLTVWIELYKWNRGTLRKAYVALTRIVRELNGEYRGRYTVLLMLTPSKVKPKRLKIAYQDEKIVSLVVDPLDFEQEEELLKLPPRW